MDSLALVKWTPAYSWAWDVCRFDYVNRIPRKIRVPQFITPFCIVFKDGLPAELRSIIDEFVRFQTLAEHREKFSLTLYHIKKNPYFMIPLPFFFETDPIHFMVLGFRMNDDMDDPEYAI